MRHAVTASRSIDVVGLGSRSLGRLAQFPSGALVPVVTLERRPARQSEFAMGRDGERALLRCNVIKKKKKGGGGSIMSTFAKYPFRY